MATINKRPTVWQMVLSVLVVLLLTVVAYFILLSLVRAIGSVFSDSSAALVSAVVAIVVPVVTLILQRSWDRQRTIEEQHRASKIEIYQEFMAFWFGVLMRSKGSKPVTEDEMHDFVVKFTQKLILWGSDEVVREYSEFRKFSGQGHDVLKMLTKFETLIKAIRKDLGHRNKDLDDGVIGGTFVNGVDELKSATSP
jgi:hypothetical protein